MNIHDLPLLNALLNGSSALCLLAGFYFIRRLEIRKHRVCMIAAFVCSALFLISYVVYHANVGSIRFAGVAKARPAAPPVVARPTTIPVSRSTARVPPPAPASRSGRILSIAASLAGIYYVYGGTTPAGFDCSGYTQYVFGKAGISLPRTAEAQRQASTRVSDPQPGDLVFFGSPAHHVGIYAGNHMMWDSEQTGVPVAMHTDRSERGGGATYGRV